MPWCRPNDTCKRRPERSVEADRSAKWDRRNGDHTTGSLRRLRWTRSRPEIDRAVAVDRRTRERARRSFRDRRRQSGTPTSDHRRGPSSDRWAASSCTCRWRVPAHPWPSDGCRRCRRLSLRVSRPVGRVKSELSFPFHRLICQWK